MAFNFGLTNKVANHPGQDFSQDDIDTATRTQTEVLVSWLIIAAVVVVAFKLAHKVIK